MSISSNSFGLLTMSEKSRGSSPPPGVIITAYTTAKTPTWFPPTPDTFAAANAIYGGKLQPTVWSNLYEMVKANNLCGPLPNTRFLHKCDEVRTRVIEPDYVAHVLLDVSHVVLVARNDKSIVGSAAMKLEETPKRGRPATREVGLEYLCSSKIAPGGMGTALMRSVISMAAAIGASSILLNSLPIMVGLEEDCHKLAEEEQSRRTAVGQKRKTQAGGEYQGKTLIGFYRRFGFQNSTLNTKNGIGMVLHLNRPTAQPLALT